MTMPLDLNAIDLLRSQQAAVTNPLVPIMVLHSPLMPALKTQIAATNKEILPLTQARHPLTGPA